MANIRGIELASEIYDLEDTSARNTATAASQTATQAGQTATQASQTATTASQTATQASETATQADEKIGSLSDLLTTVKTNIVAAINELFNKINNIRFHSLSTVDLAVDVTLTSAGLSYTMSNDGIVKVNASKEGAGFSLILAVNGVSVDTYRCYPSASGVLSTFTFTLWAFVKKGDVVAIYADGAPEAFKIQNISLQSYS